MVTRPMKSKPTFRNLTPMKLKWLSTAVERRSRGGEISCETRNHKSRIILKRKHTRTVAIKSKTSSGTYVMRGDDVEVL